LIASGSNDREIKILVTPNLENEEALNQLLVLVLKGHTAIVRTVCFDPSNDLVLLSGGLSKNFVPNNL
jgi:WD40 repeat protein